MLKFSLAIMLVFGLANVTPAQEKTASKPVELDVLKQTVGVWDAEIEVWTQGPDQPSVKFKGVETNRAYGDYWIASDFDSVFGGQTVKVHSIVGYDADLKKLVGTIVDEGPYAAKMEGDYDPKSKTVDWVTKVKDAKGKLIVQKTSITQKSDDERILVLSTTGATPETSAKFMQIRFRRRK